MYLYEEWEKFVTGRGTDGEWSERSVADTMLRHICVHASWGNLFATELVCKRRLTLAICREPWNEHQTTLHDGAYVALSRTYLTCCRIHCDFRPLHTYPEVAA